MKIGILREAKLPPDRRVPLSPAQCNLLIHKYPELSIYVQPSSWRTFSDKEYESEGITIKEDLSKCDILLGVKEVPPDLLIPEKTYMFFSHTIKMQPYNRELLREILRRKITLIDYECLMDAEKVRIIGFGRFAGLVGAYNGIRGYGLRMKLFTLKPANECHDQNELMSELKKVKLPPVKIVVTGSGRVAKGAMELLSIIPVRQVMPDDFLNTHYDESIFTQLYSKDYNTRMDDEPWNSHDYYENPDQYRSTFHRYIPHTDILIHCPYWDPRSPALFSAHDMRSKAFRIKVIADITCDIQGSIPATIKPSTIETPFYGYDPESGQEAHPFDTDSITIMAVDNLPCELPKDASVAFGQELVSRVLPELLSGKPDKMIELATIAKDGSLTEHYRYLKDFVA